MSGAIAAFSLLAISVGALVVLAVALVAFIVNLTRRSSLEMVYANTATSVAAQGVSLVALSFAGLVSAAVSLGAHLWANWRTYLAVAIIGFLPYQNLMFGKQFFDKR